MVVLADMLIDELIELRRVARETTRNYKLSDEIRTELDSRGCFVVDAPEGQIVYHLGLSWTREQFINRIREIDENFRTCLRFKSHTNVCTNQSGATSGA